MLPIRMPLELQVPLTANLSAIKYNKKLSYHRGTAQCSMSADIMSTTA